MTTTSACRAGRCADGQVMVDFGSGANLLCVDAPPRCPAGQFPSYTQPHSNNAGRDGSGDVTLPAFWHCVGPCDWIVHYGGVFAFRSVCADTPPGCPTGQVSRFSVETENWECVSTSPSCGSFYGTYDQVIYGIHTACVPC
jgi:hypothetical protein